MSDPSSQPVINQVKGAKNVVAADTIEKVVIEAEKGRSYVPRMAPPISELLTGREGTIRVLVGKMRLRQKKTGSQQILALKGMGGIGKTTLAAALAHHPKVEKELPDGTLWVSLGPEPDLMSLLGEWGEQFDEDLSSYTSPAARSRALSSILYEKKIFIVIDDVWRAEDAGFFAVGGDRGRVLLTTRNAEVARAVAGQNVFQVETLTEDTSFDLLKKLASKAATSDEIRTRQLISQLGGLPLGLTIAGRLLAEAKETGVGVQGILDELQEQEKRVEMSYESQSLETVLGLSYQWLAEESYKQAFRSLAVFGGKPNTFSLNAATEICGLDLHSMRKIMVVLVNRALVEVVGEERYTLHALVADFASTLVNASENNQAHLRYVKYFLKVAKQYTADNIKEWYQWDSDWNNIRLSANWLSAKTELTRSAVENELMADFAVALNIIVQIRKPLEGLKWLLAGENACQVLNRVSDQGWLILTIGSIELDTGAFDQAVGHFEQCAKIFDAVGEVQGSTYARGNLGLFHHKRGEYSRALEVYEQVTRMCESSGDTYGTAVMYCNQGDVYYLIGDLPNALLQLTKGISLARQKNIQDLLVKALALNGRIHLESGTIPEAFDCSQEAYSIAQQTGSSILLGVANQSMGEVWASKWEFEIAKQYFQKSIQLLTESKVQEELAEAHVAYGNFLAHNGQAQDVKTHWSNAIEIFEQIGASSRAQKIDDALKRLGKI